MLDFAIDRLTRVSPSYVRIPKGYQTRKRGGARGATSERDDLVNLEFVGVPKFLWDSESNSFNPYKFKLLELEDNVYKIDQNLNNCEVIKRLFEKIASVMGVKVEARKRADRSKRGFALSKEAKRGSQKVSLVEVKAKRKKSNESVVVFELDDLIAEFLSSSDFRYFDSGELSRSKGESKKRQEKTCEVGPKPKRQDHGGEKKGNLEDRQRAFKEKVFVHKLVEYVKNNDIIFLLDKIRRLEKQFNLFKFIKKQRELNIDKLSLKYSISRAPEREDQKLAQACRRKTSPRKSTRTRAKSARKRSDELCKPEKLDSESADDGTKDPICKSLLSDSEVSSWQVFYAKISRLAVCDVMSNRRARAQVRLSMPDRECLSQYITGSLQTIEQRIINMTQQKKIRIKEKQHISQTANAFFQDQQIINRLTANFNQVEEFTISRVFKHFETGDDALPQTCYFYDQRFPCGLRPNSGRLGRELVARFKWVGEAETNRQERI